MERKTNQRNLSEEERREIKNKKLWAKIPCLNFPTDWCIKIVPPTGGVIVRFRVIKGNAEVSIYLDYLNYPHNKTYWEVWPIGDDVKRFDLLDTQGLLQAISRSIEEQNDPSLLDYDDEDF